MYLCERFFLFIDIESSPKIFRAYLELRCIYIVINIIYCIIIYHIIIHHIIYIAYIFFILKKTYIYMFDIKYNII